MLYFLSPSKPFVHYENVSSSDLKQETLDSKDAGSCLNKQEPTPNPHRLISYIYALLMPVFLSAAAVEVISRLPSYGINQKKIFEYGNILLNKQIVQLRDFLIRILGFLNLFTH